MKKIRIVLISALMMIALCACGETEQSQIQQRRCQNAADIATAYIIPTLREISADPGALGVDMSDLTYNEISVIPESAGFTCDGYVFSNALTSFIKGREEAGEIIEIGEAKTTVDGNDIIVNVECKCEKRFADIEVIINNDLINPEMKSAAFNTVYTLGEKMSKAGLNTVIGMGTVFIMLIIISFIISLFGLFSKGGVKKEVKTSVDRAVEQIEKNETAELASNAELVAVIAAAIAAYEGSGDASGFVVRSVRKIKRQ